MRAILMFHCVDTTRSALSISAGELASLILAIRASGHAIVSVRDLLEHGRAPDKAVAFTFDDGALSVAEIAAPILNELGVPATVFLATGYVGLRSDWQFLLARPTRFPLMTWGHVERLFAAGHAIEAHSVTHPDLRAVADDQLEEEIARPIEEIGQRLGMKPTMVAYPYGFHDDRVVARVRNHYRYGLTTCLRSLGMNEHSLRIPRIDAAYLRSSLVQRMFGDGIAFRLFMARHRLVRRLRQRA